MKRQGSLNCRMPATDTDETGGILEMTYRKKPAMISLNGGVFR